MSNACVVGIAETAIVFDPEPKEPTFLPAGDCGRDVADDLAAALRAYRKAGFGNSTDFQKQAIAYDLATRALAKYEGLSYPAGESLMADCEAVRKQA